MVRHFELSLSTAIQLLGHPPRQGDWIEVNGEECLIYKVDIEEFREEDPDTYWLEDIGPMVYLKVYPRQGNGKRVVY